MQTGNESHDWEFEGLVGGLIRLGGTEGLGWAGIWSLHIPLTDIDTGH